MYQALVLLYRSNASVEAFRAFERKAIAIVSSHGGELVTAFVPEKGQVPNPPDEIHLIAFPSKKAFDAYRTDPQTMALADERNSVIEKTIIYTSDEIVKYLS